VNLIGIQWRSKVIGTIHVPRFDVLDDLASRKDGTGGKVSHDAW
jgi:hypothetical protein